MTVAGAEADLGAAGIHVGFVPLADISMANHEVGSCSLEPKRYPLRRLLAPPSAFFEHGSVKRGTILR